MFKNDIQSKLNFTNDTKLHINTITIHNGCNTPFVKILCKEREGNFNFKLNLLSRLPNTVEL